MNHEFNHPIPEINPEILQKIMIKLLPKNLSMPLRLQESLFQKEVQLQTLSVAMHNKYKVFSRLGWLPKTKKSSSLFMKTTLSSLLFNLVHKGVFWSSRRWNHIIQYIVQEPWQEITYQSHFKWRPSIHRHDGFGSLGDGGNCFYQIRKMKLANWQLAVIYYQYIESSQQSTLLQRLRDMCLNTELLLLIWWNK